MSARPQSPRPSRLASLGRHVSKVGYLVRYEGVPTATRVLLSELFFVLGIRVRTGYRYHEYFDTKTGAATIGSIPAEELDIPADRRVHSSEYVATPAPLVRHVLSTLDIPFERFSFIDFGSGKGRVLLVAAEQPFATIIGIELAPTLHEVAVRNIAMYQRQAPTPRDIESLCMDVVDFELPSTPSVLYFFNPFDEAVFETVLANVRASLRSNPQHTILIYYHNSQRDSELIDRLGLFREITSGSYDSHTWLIYEFDPSVHPVL